MDRINITIIGGGVREELARRFQDAGYRIIPGSLGEMEWMFKLEPGDTTLLKWYQQIRQAVK